MKHFWFNTGSRGWTRNSFWLQLTLCASFRSSVFPCPLHQLASCDILWVRMTPVPNCFLNYNDNVLNLALAPVNLAALPRLLWVSFQTKMRNPTIWPILSTWHTQEEEEQLKNCPHDIALQTYLWSIFLVANWCPVPLWIIPDGPALYEKGGWTWPWERISKKHSFRV